MRERHDEKRVNSMFLGPYDKGWSIFDGFFARERIESTSVLASGELQNSSGEPIPRPDWLPEVFFTIRILGVELWQWTALTLLLVLSVLRHGF